MPQSATDTADLVFQNSDLMCFRCEDTVKGALKGIAGIKTTKISRNWIFLTVEKNEKDRIKAQCQKNLAAIGYELASSADITQKKFRKSLFKGLISTLCGLSLMMLCILKCSIPMLFMYVTAGLSLAILLGCGWDMYRNAFAAMKNKSINIDTLFSISSFMAFFTSILAIFFPALGLSMNFDAALMITGFRQLGKAIENKAIQNARPNLDYRHNIPKQVSVLNKNDGTETTVEIHTIKPGDILVIRDGEKPAVNGKVIAKPPNSLGSTDETATSEKTQPTADFGSNTSGRAQIRVVKNGDLLLAGTQVTKGPLYLEATASEEDSYLNALQKDSLQNSSSKENTVTRIISIFIPATLTLSLLVFTIVSLKWSFTLGLNISLSILVATCPCILGLIIAMIIDKGVQAVKADNEDITILKPEALQGLHEADVVLLDINSTLTEGKPTVICPPAMIEDDLQILYSIETTSSNSVAQAICKYLKSERKDSATTVSAPSFYKHETLAPPSTKVNTEQYQGGILATVEKNGLHKKYIVGNETLLRSQNISFENFVIPTTKPTQVVTYFADVDQNKILGSFITEDRVRPTAKKFAQRLNDWCQNASTGGKKKYIKLCTGASRQYAEAIAKELEIAGVEIYSADDDPNIQERQRKKTDIETKTSQQKIISSEHSLSPQELEHAQNNMGIFPKRSFVIDQKNKGYKTIMIGDGLNDGFANINSTWAITAKCEVTPTDCLTNNHAVIPAENLSALFSLFEISAQTTPQIRRSTYLSLFLNGVSVLAVTCLPLFLGIHINPGLAAGFMLIQSALVCGYTYSFKPEVKKDSFDFGVAPVPLAGSFTHTIAHSTTKIPDTATRPASQLLYVLE